MIKMKRILILTDHYPSPTILYSNGFTHTRAKAYQKHAEVLIVCFKHHQPPYIYEGIEVESYSTENQLRDRIASFAPDLLCVHFFSGVLLDILLNASMPVYVWLHGVEAIGWYRRWFNYSIPFFVKAGYKNALENTKQLSKLRKLYKHSNEKGNIHFVIVSNWLKETTETDTFIKLKNFHIIPNPIDEELFEYREKTAEDRLQVLSLRPYVSNTYANDISVRTVLEFSKYPMFEHFHFSFFGMGYLFDRLTKPLKEFPNVTIEEKFFENHEIPSLHARFGLFLCPSRQDTHGVSRSEATSSGLVALTSNNSAIPEFVQDRKTGLFGKTPKDFANLLKEIYDNPDLFLKLSKQGALDVRRQCGKSVIIDEELRILKILLDP
jgi:glycosyltransferase involved in cell wall biosynthesis